MLNAGICAPVPKGDWLNNVQYDPLNLVNHNGYSWIAKRQSLGQEPTEGQYWMQFGTAVPIATTSVAGKVKPDGVSILITGEGVISALLSGLTDVELTDLDDGQVIAWDETENKFVNKDISTTLAGLQDVDLTGLQDNQILAFNALTQTWEPIDPPSGGFSEVLIDYDPTEMTGITVTLAHTASAEGHTPESYTITLDNTGEVEQDVKNLGLWTITWTHNGQSYTESFDIHYFGYFHVMLHEGFTWRLWATAGGIPINQYNSLSQLLADEEAVRRLFIVHDAVDYMCNNANSTQNQDLITIINNGLCAKWANLNDYALDNMEADAVLSDLMDDADLYGYGELIEDNGDYVPKGNVPVMTSNTAPYGEVFSTSPHQSNPGWQAFDKNVSTSGTFTNAVNNVIGYKFTNPVMPKKLIYSMTDNNKYVVKASNDGSNWDTISEEFTGQAAINIEIPLTATKYYLYCEICETVKVATSASYTTFREIQFYGRELKVSVPKMTSNTAPYGEASASHAASSYPAWQVFDGNDVTAWSSGVTTNCWVSYESIKPMRAEFVKLKVYKGGSGNSELKNFKIQGSNDGTNWDDLYTGLVPVGGTDLAFTLDNPTNYKYHRLYAIDTYHTSVGILTLQFYGKDYSEKEFANDGSKWLYDHGVYPTNNELEEISDYEGSPYVNRGVINDIGGTGFDIDTSVTASSFKTLGFKNSEDLTANNLLRMRNNIYNLYGADACLDISSILGSNYIAFESFTSQGGVAGSAMLVTSAKHSTPELARKSANGHIITVHEVWLE